MHIIRDGNVIVTKDSNKIAVLQKGDLLGNVIDFFEGRPSTYTFTNEKSVSLYTIDAEDFGSFVKSIISDARIVFPIIKEQVQSKLKPKAIFKKFNKELSNIKNNGGSYND